MTAAELAEVDSLAEAAKFRPHVYWADGLEQVEMGVDQQGHQLDLFAAPEDATRGGWRRPEVRAALAEVLVSKFHAVVANPPYITEGDGEFSGATGLITSNFTFSAEGDVVDNQYVRIYTP